MQRLYMWAGIVSLIACTGCADGPVKPTPPTARGEPLQDLRQPDDASTSLATGLEHTCALTHTGQAYCWGWGILGQLGIGEQATEPVRQPAAVLGGLTFLNLSVGYYHTCAIAASGRAFCWGYNGQGQVGTAGLVVALTPTPIQSDVVFASVAAGRYFTCAITAAGEAYCWGQNTTGQGGRVGGPPEDPTPLPVATRLRFRSIATGAFHTCGLTAVGFAYCWGDNFYGQLGSERWVRTSARPLAVQGGHRFQSLSLGYGWTCGVSVDGAAYCWGDNWSGQLGDGTKTNRTLPVPVSGGETWQNISAGEAHTCGAATAGRVLCWGFNRSGQLGTGDTVSTAVPTLVQGNTRYRVVAGGTAHSCATAASNSLYCWGFNRTGQLGNGTRRNSLIPTPVTGTLR